MVREFYSLDASHCDPKGNCCKPDFSDAIVPGVKCDVCGSTWGSSTARLYGELPRDYILRGKKPRPVSLYEFNSIVSDLRGTMGLARDSYVEPGTRVGTIHLKCERQHTVDFESPIINIIVVTDRVVSLLESSDLTGWRAEPVIVSQLSVPGDPPALYELCITGHGGLPPHPTVSLVSKCVECGREVYDEDYDQMDLSKFNIDETQWDGSDFFRLSAPFEGFNCITERAKSVIGSSGLTNHEIVSMSIKISKRHHIYKMMRGED